MPAHVIYGDSFLVAERLRRVKAEAGVADLMDSNRHVVSAGQARPDEVLATCNSLPFLDTMRLVEIEGVLATQQGSGGGRRSGRRSASATGAWSQLTDAVPTLPDTTFLIFVDGDVQQGNPLLRSLSEHCAVHREATPNAQALLQWIKQRAEDKGSSITPPAMQVLAELVGGDLWTIDRELEKLSLYATGRSITDADVRAMVPYAQEANIFAAVDSIMDGRPGPALRSFMQLMEDGQEPLYIIAMIERQLRLIALARDLTDRGVAQPDLGRRMGTNSDFVVRKTLGQARRLTLTQIRSKYRRVLESDLAIKQGRLEPALSLQLLVADLATS
ncbi:MAG: DNA polymerase III subunit delta [Chloroflexota bacterium]|nr:DNA polymerase III subunit delta [Chloroflexota bacterium]MDE2961600.1 DNA polymerase III subunit delta [Chloroflexota bacterium]